ncbi:MAG: polysaccharide pyruvyl transferase family protein, partial [Phormidesmis sp.]
FDPAYFLSFVDGKTTRRASYAASFGFTTGLQEKRDRVKALIDQFDAIAVRDTNSLSIIQNECQANANKVLDPTFLGSYSALISPPKHKKYMLIYGGLTPEQQQHVKAIATAKRAQIISIGYACKCADVSLSMASPQQWLSYFAHAEGIFTSFFHGVIFSIIFKRPFYAFARADKSVKINDLLSDLQLQDRVIAEGDYSQPIFEPIEYEGVGDRLAPLLQNSSSYITNTLSTANHSANPSEKAQGSIHPVSSGVISNS